MELADRLKELADENDQSLNKEVIDRLEQTLLDQPQEKKVFGNLTAKQAKELADAGAEQSRNDLFERAMDHVNAAAEIGYTSVNVSFKAGRHDKEYERRVAEPVAEKFRELGYKAIIVYDRLELDFGLEEDGIPF